jgi:hypothetical protein
MLVRVTHEFVDNPVGLDRAFDTWALLLARSLTLGDINHNEENIVQNTHAISLDNLGPLQSEVDVDAQGATESEFLGS